MAQTAASLRRQSIAWRAILVVAVCASAMLVPTSPAVVATLFDQLQVPGGLHGIASWYGGGERLHRLNASGSRMNPDALEAAIWDVPFGTLVKMIHRDNGRSVIVRITDRGPSHRYPQRVIDLSRRAFRELAPLRQGLVPVSVEPVDAQQISR